MLEAIRGWNEFAREQDFGVGHRAPVADKYADEIHEYSMIVSLDASHD